MTKINFLNIDLDNIKLSELLERTNNETLLILTPNVDHLVKLKTDPDFLKIYRIADCVVCDSRILQYGMKFSGQPVPEKISGSDLFPAFYEYHKNNEKVKIFILGGTDSVAEQAKTNINNKVGREIVVSALSPSFGFEKNETECLEIVEKINNSGANILAIGVGAPKQEKWILKYRHLMPKIKIYLPIGATIDFEAGKTSRAPKWMSNAGLEWFYRLVAEPKRLWKRYLVDSVPFFVDVVKFRSKRYINDPIMDLKSLPLGMLLYKAGILSSEEVATLLQIQKQREYNIRIGEIAVEQGLLSPETITFFVEKLPLIVAEKQILLLEEYLIQAHLISQSQLDSYLAQTIESSKSVIELIQEQNEVSPRTIQWFEELAQIIK